MKKIQNSDALKQLELQNKGFDLIRGDVREKKSWFKSLKNVSYIFHLAAYQDQRPDFSKFFDVNTKSTALLYEIIAEKKLPIKKIVLASTQFVYGDGEYLCPHSKKEFFPESRSLQTLKIGDWSIKKIFFTYSVPSIVANFPGFSL